MIAQTRTSILHGAGARPSCRGQSISMFLLECRTCGYEPCDQDSLPAGPCPKCHASAWWRCARPGSLLAAADAADDARITASRVPRGRQA